MVDNIIETFDLNKKFKLKGKKKEILALNNINLRINKGENFGLLGPNGAGKTTLVQILTTLLNPTSGYALIDGYNILTKPLYVKKRIGLVLGIEMIYYRITGYDNLKFFCKIYNISDYKNRINDIAKEFDLYDWLNQYVEKYSLGMKLKLSLCRALLIDPPILFLDEPTLGLDVKSTAFLIDRLKSLKKTIFLTSHNMNVVERLCNRIAIINEGKILKFGTQEELTKLMKKDIKVSIDIINNKEQLKLELLHRNFITIVNDTKDGLIINLKNKENYRDLLSVLSNYDIIKIQEQDTHLEELLIKITS